MGMGRSREYFFGYIMKEWGRFYTRCDLEHGVLDGVSWTP